MQHLCVCQTDRPFLLTICVVSFCCIRFGRNYTEFLAATLEAHGHIEEERIADAFDRLDCDGSGYVSKEDLKEFLGNSATAKDIDELIKEGDKDKDGQRECLYERNWGSCFAISKRRRV